MKRKELDNKMFRLSKKIAAVGLTLTTAVWLSGAAAVMPVASAQSAADLQAQIAALLAQINSLQAQLGTSPSSAPAGSSVSCSLTRNLTVGSSGEDVKCLQQWLNANGYQVSASGAGSPGNETMTFGPATRAAVAKFQAANGISPAAGYFGPLTRAKIASMVAVTPPPTGTTPPPTGTTPPPTGTVPTPGVVTIMPGSNAGGSIISGASQVPVLNFKIMNGTASDVTVTGMKFTKTGVVSDANISNAYLSMGNNIVAQYMSLASGVVTFSGNLVTVPAGQTADMYLRMDISSGTSNGNTIGFALMQAADVALSSGSVSGSFPLTGGTYVTTSVSNPSLATVSSVSYQSVASEVDAGTNGFRSSALSLTVNNSPVKMMSLRYTVTGSVNYAADLRNMVLKVDGVDVATAASLMSDGKVYFDMSANAPVLGTGSHQIEVYADVMGTPNRTFKYEILRPYDWVFQDTQYGTNITAGTPSGTAQQVSVRQGTLTASLSSDTPTGNVARGASNVTIAKFAIRAAGEAVKIKWMPYKVTEGGSVASWGTPTNVDSDIRNLSLYADDGLQLGTTINTPSSCTYGTPETTATTYICSFGSPTSNINYIIPANTTRVFSLRSDIQSGGDITSIKGSLLAPADTSGFTGNNIEGQQSFQTGAAPGGTIDGSNLTIAASPFQASQNSSLAAQTFVGGAYAAKVGSFSLSASAAEPIKLTSLTVRTSANVNSGSSPDLKMQNLTAKVGATSWNYTVPSISGSTSYTFSSPGAPTVIPAGGTVVVDVYADILTGSTATTTAYTAPLSLVGAVGFGGTTNTNQTLKDTAGTAISTSNTVAGQNLTIAGGGSLSVSVNTSQPPAQQIVLGATGVSLGQYRFTADNNEDLKITDLTVTASSTSGTSAPATFSNLKLYDGSTEVGQGTALSGSSGAYTSSFHFSNPLVVSKNSTKEYILKGDVATYTASPSSHNQSYRFNVQQVSHVTAYGVASNQSVSATSSIGFPLSANTQNTLRTKLTAAMAVNGSATRSRNSNDEVAKLTLSVDPAYGAEFKNVQLTFSGTALSGTTSTVSLVDDATGVVMATSTFSSVVTTPTLTMASPSSDGLITAGQSKAYRIRIDSSNFTDVNTQTETLSIQIAGASNLAWQTQGSSETLGLQSKDVPITVTLSY